MKKREAKGLIAVTNATHEILEDIYGEQLDQIMNKMTCIEK